MIRFLGVKILLFVSVLSASFAFANAEVRISSEASIRAGEPILFGDLLETSSLRDDQKKLMKDVVLFDTFENEQKTYSSAEVSQAIQRSLILKDNLQKVSLRIPPNVIVKKIASAVWPTTTTVESQVKETLHKNCDDCEAIIRNLNIPAKPGRSLSEIIVDYDSTNLIGAFTLPMRYKEDNKIKTAWITGQTVLKKRAPVAKRQLSIGDRVSADDFSFELVDLTFARDTVPSEKMLLGASITRSIAAGKPIMSSDLKREPYVQKGQVVKIILGNPDFEITTQGISEQNGFLGEVIRLKSSDNQKIFSGTIVEKGTVRIE